MLQMEKLSAQDGWREASSMTQLAQPGLEPRQLSSTVNFFMPVFPTNGCHYKTEQGSCCPQLPRATSDPLLPSHHQLWPSFKGALGLLWWSSG